MATMLEPPRRKRVRRALGSLFREARRLEHRRRRRYAAAVVLVGAIAGGSGLLLADDGASFHFGRNRGAPLVASLTLPRAGDFFALGVVGDRVIVSGGPKGSLFPSGSSTTLSEGRAVGTCDAATVKPGSLSLGRVRHANCGDPALYDEQVLAVGYLAQPASRTHGVGEFAVRIARADPAARDGYTLGRVVMTYQQCSDCDAQWIYGDDSLWLYGHGELLRISDTSGNVVQRWAVPPDPQELLAVDADGLWFAPSVVGGWPLHTSASRLIDYKSLYRVTPGAKAPSRVFKIPGGSALWLVAAGHTVWLESGGPRAHSRFELWRLQGPSARPIYHGRYPAHSNPGADIGDAQPTHAGNTAIGIYFVNDPGSGASTVTGQRIIKLSADAASQRTVATVQPQTEIDMYGEGPPGVALGRSFYFLDPALLSYSDGSRSPIVHGRGILYEVTPSLVTRAK
ncbi:MAG: hypothetical protein ACRDL5_18875 [Solirubrobacteraceae bacterium]